MAICTSEFRMGLTALEQLPLCRRYEFNLFATLIALATIITSDPISSLTAVGVLWAVTRLGTNLCVLARISISQQEVLLLFGLVVGLVAFTGIHFLSGRLWGPLGSIFITMLLSLVSECLPTASAGATEVDSSRGQWASYAILSSGCYLLNASLEYSWYFCLSVSCFAIYLMLSRHVVQTIQRFTLIFITLAVPVAGILSRPAFWNLQQEEQVLQNLIAVSLADKPSLTPAWSAAGNITYHWLPYPLTGVITRVTSFSEYTVISVIMPLVLGVLFFSALFGYLRRMMSPTQSAVACVTTSAFSAVGFVFTDFRILGSNLSPGLIVGAMCGFALAILMTESHWSNLGIRESVGQLSLIATCTFVLSASKVDLALPLLRGSALLQIGNLFETRTSPVRVRLELLKLVALVVGAIPGLALVSGVGSTNRYYSLSPSSIVNPNLDFINFWGDLANLVGIQRLMFALLAFMGIYALSLALLVSPETFRARGLIRLNHLTFAVGALLTGTLSFGGAPAQLTFVRAVLILSIPLGIAQSVANYYKLTSSRERLTAFSIVAAVGLTVWLIQFIMERQFAPGGSLEDMTIRVSRFAVPVASAMIVFLTIGLGLRGCSYTPLSRLRSTSSYPQTTSIQRRTGFLVTSVVFSGVIYSTAGLVESFAFSKERLSTRGSAYLGTTDVRTTADFIKDFSPKDYLAALDKPASSLETQVLVSRSGRRFLTLGRFWGFDDTTSREGARNMEISRSINYLSKETLRDLCNVDVRTLVVQNLHHLPTIAAQLGPPNYENQTYAVYILTECEST